MEVAIFYYGICALRLHSFIRASDKLNTLELNVIHRNVVVVFAYVELAGGTALRTLTIENWARPGRACKPCLVHSNVYWGATRATPKKVYRKVGCYPRVATLENEPVSSDRSVRRAAASTASHPRQMRPRGGLRLSLGGSVGIRAHGLRNVVSVLSKGVNGNQRQHTKRQKKYDARITASSILVCLIDKVDVSHEDVGATGCPATIGCHTNILPQEDWKFDDSM